MRVLNAFYDMAVSPCSYDFFTFLFSSELCRVRRKLDAIKLVIVHGPDNFFRDDQIRTLEQNKTFFENVIVPGISLLPTCTSFMWMKREELNFSQIDPTFVFPRGYKPTNPVPEYIGNDLVASRIRGDTPSFLDAPSYAKKFAQDFITSIGMNKPIITLTTREISRDNQNSTRTISHNVWREAFQKLSKNFTPVVIRDSFHCHDEPLFEEIIECPQASVHLPFRLALYEKARMNFSKNTGPALLLFYGRTNATYFNKFDNDVIAVSQTWFENNYGITEGGQYPMTTLSKKYCWEPETSFAIENFAHNSSESSQHVLELNELDRSDDAKLSIVTASRVLIKNIRHELMREDVLLHKMIKDLILKFNLDFDLNESLLKLNKDMFPPGTVKTLILESEKLK